MHKPTFINMDLAHADLYFNNFFVDNGLNSSVLNLVFGNNLNMDWLNSFKIDHSIDYFSIWASPTHNTSIAASVYYSISSNNNCHDSWDGWNQIWKFCVIP